MSAPRRTEIRVPPTVEAYQRATGRAWWTSAATSDTADGGYRIDIAPERTSGDLNETLRHELVHVLTGEALRWSPAWAAEGLATLVSRPESATVAGGASAPAACPSDAQVRRPGQAASRDTYRAAAACVAATLPDGLSGWRRLVGLWDAPPKRAGDVYAQ